MRFITLFFLSLCLSTISTTIPAHAEWTVTIKPSKIQKIFVRGELYFACTSTSHLFEFLDQGRESVLSFKSNDPACGTAPMTAVTRRNNYRASDGVLYEIYVYYIHGTGYYTYNLPGGRRHRN